MTPLSLRSRTFRLACWPALLMALVACAGGPREIAGASLDLGGGLSMTPDGQILGATPAQPSLLADDSDTLPPAAVAASPATAAAVHPQATKQ